MNAQPDAMNETDHLRDLPAAAPPSKPNVSFKDCMYCGEEIRANAVKCRHCGEFLDPAMRAAEEAKSERQQQNVVVSLGSDRSHKHHSGKTKGTAAVLALFLGGLGAHKFYLDRPVQGIVYLVFCFTFVPAIISFFEGIYYALMSEDEFQQKYG
ncbi:MAG: TM2 domain-containing protein [Boseongicola sp.]|nr:TM2 domain-containing protein [Boseongicola sp.]